MAPSENRPASMKARTTVRPDSTMMIGVPMAFGATARTAEAKRAITALSLESPFGNTSIRARPSGAIQSRDEFGRQRFARHRLGRQRRPQSVEKAHKVDRHGGLGRRALTGIGCSEAVENIREAARRVVRGSRVRAGDLAQGCGRAAQGFDVLGVARRRLDRRRMQHRVEQHGGVPDEGQLLVLVSGMKVASVTVWDTSGRASSFSAAAPSQLRATARSRRWCWG